MYLIAEQALLSEQVLNSSILPARFLLIKCVVANLKKVKQAYSAIGQARVVVLIKIIFQSLGKVESKKKT